MLLIARQNLDSPLVLCPKRKTLVDPRYMFGAPVPRPLPKAAAGGGSKSSAAAAKKKAAAGVEARGRAAAAAGKRGAKRPKVRRAKGWAGKVRSVSI